MIPELPLTTRHSPLATSFGRKLTPPATAPYSTKFTPMTREIPKAYEPQEIEHKWAQAWYQQQLFRADPQTPGEMFSIVIPPPNVTGSLHIGHMLDHTEIDILTRWHRMRGHNALFLPGTDHASISTQRVVVRQLAAQGIDYRALGREEFEKRVWHWKEESGGEITRQMVAIGDSCDWTRERFTMDPGLSNAVMEVFVRLYEEGLIYRGRYIVNWCPSCLTAISDLETIHQERDGKLWYFRYPVIGTTEHLVIATTRPETMLGDTAVAVHPDDERYRHLVGKKVLLPLMNREIPVIADSFVDREFGTGAVKITPAHDPNDFEAGKRHNLPEIDVMSEDGHMSAAAGAYAGLDRFAARKRVVEDLTKLGLVERVEPHRHAVGTCDRCKTDVEPRLSKQWFVKMKPLAAPAIRVVEDGEILITPENRRTEYLNWMNNIRDWCISRQLWWGLQIPAWHCRDCGGITVARTTPAKCQACGSAHIERDPDVLDTWFSAALWPFSTMGWPEETADLKRYYPTTLLITGYDILFFWVARMIVMGLKFTGKVPFRTVYLHSLVLNAEGVKMSKSKGTGIDPIELNKRFGTDAMRFTLASMAAPGTDIILSDDRLLGSRAFANKIWNAARFLFVNLEKAEASGVTLEELAGPEIRAAAPYRRGAQLELADRWIFSRLAHSVAEVNAALKEYRFHEAAHVVYHFFWGEFCDWYIEWVKPRLTSGSREELLAAWRNLFAVFESALRLLHPLMPFLTEELWHRLPQRAGAKSIALQRFPEIPATLLDPAAEKEMALLQEIIAAARNARADLKLDAKRKVAGDFFAAGDETRTLVQSHLDPILRLASLSTLHILPPGAGRLDPSQGAVRASTGFELRIPFGEAVDLKTEVAKLSKERDRLARDIESKTRRLAEESFRSKAPAEIVKGLETTLQERRAEHHQISERLAQLEKALQLRR
jgi:valyl-tRNA synthetase